MNTLGHVNIRTDRMEETLAFYENVLGLRRGDAATNPNRDENTWLFDASGAAVVHVNALRAGEEVPAGVASRLDHVAFNCDARDAMAARLDALGLPYRAAQTRLPGMIQFNLLDPNGIRVELTFGHDLVRGAPF